MGPQEEKKKIIGNKVQLVDVTTAKGSLQIHLFAIRLQEESILITIPNNCPKENKICF